ncbi:MAG: hypothetical protein HYZ81_11275 [Nitrospinae bacterium]|nr:hypothetical protein [Nitrospinota bacterium]
MKKSEKSFDAVKMMREIRDKLSIQFRDMSFGEQKQYIQERLHGRPMKSRQAERSTQTGSSPLAAAVVDSAPLNSSR